MDLFAALCQQNATRFAVEKIRRKQRMGHGLSQESYDAALYVACRFGESQVVCGKCAPWADADFRSD